MMNLSKAGLPAFGAGSMVFKGVASVPSIYGIFGKPDSVGGESSKPMACNSFVHVDNGFQPRAGEIMFKHLHYVAYVLLLPAVIASAEDKRGEQESTIVSGMSIVGNNETPKSLYIVPWKNSEVGNEVNFTSSVLKEELAPVDKSDFVRELGFYRSSNPN